MSGVVDIKLGAVKMSDDLKFNWTTGVDKNKKRFDRLKMPNGVYVVKKNRSLWGITYKPNNKPARGNGGFFNKVNAMLDCQRHARQQVDAMRGRANE